MFLIEKNNRIRLTKGDTATMLVEAYDLDKKKYTFAPDDKIVLTVRKTVNAPISFQKEANELITLSSIARTPQNWRLVCICMMFSLPLRKALSTLSFLPPSLN